VQFLSPFHQQRHDGLQKKQDGGDDDSTDSTVIVGLPAAQNMLGHGQHVCLKRNTD